MVPPLKFTPVFQSRIWGGSRIKSLLGKSLPREFTGKPIAESWELADLPAGTVKGESTGGNPDGSIASVVATGPSAGKNLRQLLEQVPKDIMGPVPLHRGHFPLLVKFLDAGTEVSVQVHPDAAYCRKHPEAHLKCEAWYIVHAEPGAKIYKGVKPGVTPEKFRAALATGDVEPLLHAIPIRAGECHYLPSGTLHALGAGALVVEVQTPSDTTFRVFDWNRLGANGKPRQLHVEEAMACIDFNQPANTAAENRNDARLVTTEYFTLDRVPLKQSTTIEIPGGEPVVWIILEGQGVITADGIPPTAFARGDTLLLPAALKGKMKTVTDGTLLEARIPH